MNHSRLTIVLPACLVLSACGESGQAGKDGGQDAGPMDAPASDVADAGGSSSDVAGFEMIPQSPDGGLVDTHAPSDCAPAILPQPSSDNPFAHMGALLCFAPSPWCGASACGNGQLDTCTYGEGCFGRRNVSEACDGTRLGGTSCESLGYAGGQLACTSWCEFDLRKCSTCAPRGDAVPSCGPAPVTIAGNPRALAVAANGAELGLVWLDADGLDGKLHVRFARLGRDLAILSETLSVASALERDARQRVVLAALPTGWLVGIEQMNGTKLVTLDMAGQPTGASRVIEGAFQLVAASRPGGGPLLSWSYAEKTDAGPGPAPPPDAPWDAGGEVSPPVIPQPPQEIVATRAAVVAADGSGMTAPVTMFKNVELGDRTALFVGDGFMVAERTRDGFGVGRVELDGSSGPPRETLLAGDYEHPRLTFSAGRTRVVYTNFGAPLATFWVELDRTGATVSPPRRLRDFGMNLVAGVQNDTVLVTGPFAMANSVHTLEFIRLNAAGDPVGNPVGVLRDPAQAMSLSLTLFDADAIVAWVGGGCPGTINLARLKL